MRSSFKLIAVAAAAGLALVACGSDGGSDAGDSDAPVVSDSASTDHSSMDMSSTPGSSSPGASASTSSSGAGAPASAASITIANFAFSPSTLTVAPGATITVTNTDSVPHDVDSDDGTSFNTSPVASDTFTFTAPMTPGSYGYFCSVHPKMKGTLIVA